MKREEQQNIVHKGKALFFFPKHLGWFFVCFKQVVEPKYKVRKLKME